MDGFVSWEAKHQGHTNASNYCDVLSSYPMSKLPVLEWLASEFALFDGYCSVPGPTWPNRAFALAGTSAGQTDTFAWFKGVNGKLLPSRTIFDQLDEANITWGYFYQTTPWEFYMQSVFTNAQRLAHFSQFQEAARAGTLPAFR